MRLSKNSKVRCTPSRFDIRLAALVLGLAGFACARHPRTGTLPELAPVDSVVRVAIALSTQSARLSSTSLLSIVDGSNGGVIATSRAGVEWTARASGTSGIELSRAGARPLVVTGAAAILRADARAGFLLNDGRSFRGAIAIWREGARLLVVNSLPMEDYLKGVVPLEIGNRRRDERAAVAAQSIAARSYTYVRLEARRRDKSRRYDMLADVSDQVYGGRDSELALASEQVDATRGMVLRFGGRVIEAVYSSACGGTTADAAELWSGGGHPYLRSVSDSIPGRSAFYCDIAPRFTWSTSIDREKLVAGVDAYLRNYARVRGSINWIDSIRAESRTPSGRVSRLALATNAGRYELAGDNIRFVLRPPGGEILRSTLFDLSPVEESGAGIVRLEVNGRGYGHGAGLCQWGAIGRARAGQDALEILATYYPGTKVERFGAGDQ